MGKKDFVLSKSDFIWAMEEYEKQHNKVQEFNDALDKMCDGYAVFDTENGYMNAFFFILNKIFGIDKTELNTIDWYLFDCSDGSRITEKNGYEVNVQGYSMLYDLLLAEYYEKKGDSTLIEKFYRENGKKAT